MRVKISLYNPETQKTENHLVSIPKHLKYIVDLQVHIIDVLGLGTYLEKNHQSIYLAIDGYNLPKKEKILELIKDNDSIR